MAAISSQLGTFFWLLSTVMFFMSRLLFFFFGLGIGFGKSYMLALTRIMQWSNLGMKLSFSIVFCLELKKTQNLVHAKISCYQRNYVIVDNPLNLKVKGQVQHDHCSYYFWLNIIFWTKDCAVKFVLIATFLSTGKVLPSACFQSWRWPIDFERARPDQQTRSLVSGVDLANAFLENMCLNL